MIFKFWRARVRRWAKRIGSEAAEFTEDVTGAKKLTQVSERLVFNFVSCFSWWWAVSIIQSLLNLQAYENFTLTLGEVHKFEVLNNTREEMKVFFSRKTSSLKVWRQESWCGRYRLGKVHLKLNPAFNVYNPVNWQHFHLKLISGNHTSCRIAADWQD